MNIEKAYKVCKDITVNHYENFPVASRLLPASSRKHIYPIYAFARHADDLADEYNDREGLFEWRERLHSCLEDPGGHPIFIALADTIRKYDLPISLFDDLLTAFLQDTEKGRYDSMEEVLAYCRYSANPVGRIILHLHGYKDDSLMRYSDHICTALQLANFWQDVKVDIKKNRIYIPQDMLQQYNIPEKDIAEKHFSENFAQLMAALVVDTRQIFTSGEPLLQHLRGRLKWELKFTYRGGVTILDKIEEIGYNVLSQRPVINKIDWLKIAGYTFILRR